MVERKEVLERLQLIKEKIGEQEKHKENRRNCKRRENIRI